MSASQGLPDTLAEDLNEIKTYLKTQDHLCAPTIQAFLVRYDVLGQAPLIRAASSLFNDSDLLEALLDNWEGLLDPITFVKFIYAFCLIQEVSITYGLFLESGGSTELLRAMDTDVKSKELIFYGARCLAVLSANPGLRASLSEGDGISLLVDCLHYHKKDPMTAVVLLVLMANLSYKNPVSKKAFADSNGIAITTSIVTANPNNSSVLMSCLHVLRHVTSNDRDVKAAEAKNRSHILKEVVTALKNHTQNEPMLIHGLWTVLNLIAGSVENKMRFFAEHGIALLDEIAVDQERNDVIMALVCTILLQMLKLQKVRTELYNRATTIPMLGRVLRTFTEPKPLFAASKALYIFAQHTGARNTIGQDLSEVILSVIRTPVHFPRLHAVLGKLVLRLCLDPEIKTLMTSLRALSAIQQGKAYNVSQHATLRYFITAEEFLQSPNGSLMPNRPDPNELLLQEHLHSEPRATSFHPFHTPGSPSSKGFDLLDDGPTIDVEALMGPNGHENHNQRGRSNSIDSESSSDDSSSTTSSSSEDPSDANLTVTSDDDDITAELKREEAEGHAKVVGTSEPVASTSEIPTEEEKKKNTKTIGEEAAFELQTPSISVVDPSGNVVNRPIPSDESPEAVTKPDGVEITSETLAEDPEMAALLKDIEITASSPVPSPRKQKEIASAVPNGISAALTVSNNGSPGIQHRRRGSRDKDASSPSLDDSLQGLDAELEKLRSEDFGGTRSLDELDSEFSWSENDTSNLSVAASDPDSVLARIEAIERMTEELDSYSPARKNKTGAEGGVGNMAISPSSPHATLSVLEEVMMTSLETESGAIKENDSVTPPEEDVEDSANSDSSSEEPAISAKKEPSEATTTSTAEPILPESSKDSSPRGETSVAETTPTDATSNVLSTSSTSSTVEEEPASPSPVDSKPAEEPAAVAVVESAAVVEEPVAIIEEPIEKTDEEPAAEEPLAHVEEVQIVEKGRKDEPAKIAPEEPVSKPEPVANQPEESPVSEEPVGIQREPEQEEEEEEEEEEVLVAPNPPVARNPSPRAGTVHPHPPAHMPVALEENDPPVVMQSPGREKPVPSAFSGMLPWIGAAIVVCVAVIAAAATYTAL